MKNAKALLFSIYRAALAGASPKTLFLHKKISGLNDFKRPLVLGAGKASLEMARAFAKSRRLSQLHGCVIVPEPASQQWDSATGLRVLEGSHPFPSGKSRRSTEMLLRYLSSATADHTIIFLLSGGASSLLELPFSGISLKELRATTRLLLNCGANIREINAVRKHLSRVKGGRLSLMMGKSQAITLVLSDVQGDRLEVIGSGPTFPDSSTYQQALNVLSRYHLEDRIPKQVRQFLMEGTRGIHPETPKKNHPAFRKQAWFLLGNASDARKGAKEKAESLGLKVKLYPKFLNEEARVVGKRLVELGNSLRAGTLLVASGEPPVRGAGKGKGGRCQEVALSFLMESAKGKPLYLLAAGTDGIDGPTDAAGAFVSPESLGGALKHAMAAEKVLEKHDSYLFFDVLGDLIRTGPTGTNVNDLFLVWAPIAGTF